jgi:tetratricopeptide (TPR) repeat protein
MKRFSIGLLLFFICAITFSCAPKYLEKEAPLDTPQYHTRIGYSLLEKGQYEKALESFNRAINLKGGKDYSPAYAGLALVHGFKKQWKEAFKFAEEALDRAKSNDHKISAHIAMGRLLSLKRDKGWIKKAKKHFSEAIKLDDKNEIAYYYRGVVNKRAYLFDEAERDFSKVIEINKTLVAEADKEWKLVNKIKRAQPGTLVGKKIALIDKIDRACVAALFVNELKVEKLLKKRQPIEVDTTFVPPESGLEMETEKIVKKAPATDIEGHWAKNFIEIVIDLNIIPPFPDHTFKPDELMTKAEFADLIAKLAVAVTGDKEILTRFGQQKTFQDVRADHYAAPAINFVTTAGILEPTDPINRIFGLTDNISGADALLAIRELEKAMKWK